MLEYGSDEEVGDVLLLLDSLGTQVAGAANFEFLQALLQLVLQVGAAARPPFQSTPRQCLL